jgi:triacylglycerol lipase
MLFTEPVPQGGLDCRYLASRITGLNFRILSVTTIATPHRGSPVADSLDPITSAKLFRKMISHLDTMVDGFGNGEGFACLTSKSMDQFNSMTPDAPGVKYFSWGAAFNPWCLAVLK